MSDLHADRDWLDRAVTLRDHFDDWTTMRVAEPQPHYGLVQLNVERKGVTISVDVKMADLRAALDSCAAHTPQSETSDEFCRPCFLGGRTPTQHRDGDCLAKEPLERLAYQLCTWWSSNEADEHNDDGPFPCALCREQAEFISLLLEDGKLDDLRPAIAPPSSSDADRDAGLSAIIEADGWDHVEQSDLMGRAADAIAWGLLDATSDTADRLPGDESYAAALETARRILAARAQPEGVERVEWGVRDTDGPLAGHVSRWGTREAAERWVGINGPGVVLRRTVTEFAPVVGEWRSVEEEGVSRNNAPDDSGFRAEGGGRR